MSDAADFLDAALQYEVSPYSYPDSDDGLARYGTSIGAVRGSVRDALKKFPGMSHDEVLTLSSELWAVPVFERRQAAIVLLQSRVRELKANDLTRVEGFLRTASSDALVEQLVADVLVPMMAAMDVADASRAMQVIDRWASEPTAALRTAALAVTDARS